MFLGKDTLWVFSFWLFYEIQFQGNFMKHKILSLNTFTLVSKFHCIYFSSKKKNSKRPKIIWLKPCLQNRNNKSAYVMLFSELLLTDKEEFRRCLRMKSTSYYWSKIDFCTLTTYTFYITHTYIYTSCIDYYII